MTGAPLEVTIRFQANFLVRPIEEISIFQNVPRKFIPAMWFEQKFVMDVEMAREIQIAVQIPWIGRVFGLVLLGVGIFFVLVACCLAFLESRKKSNRQQMEINLGDKRVGARLKKEASPLIHRLVRPQIVHQGRGKSS